MSDGNVTTIQSCQRLVLIAFDVSVCPCGAVKRETSPNDLPRKTCSFTPALKTEVVAIFNCFVSLFQNLLKSELFQSLYVVAFQWDPRQPRLAICTANNKLYMWSPAGCVSVVVPTEGKKILCFFCLVLHFCNQILMIFLLTRT